MTSLAEILRDLDNRPRWSGYTWRCARWGHRPTFMGAGARCRRIGCHHVFERPERSARS